MNPKALSISPDVVSNVLSKLTQARKENIAMSGEVGKYLAQVRTHSKDINLQEQYATKYNELKNNFNTTQKWEYANEQLAQFANEFQGDRALAQAIQVFPEMQKYEQEIQTNKTLSATEKEAALLHYNDLYAGSENLVNAGQTVEAPTWIPSDKVDKMAYLDNMLSNFKPDSYGRMTFINPETGKAMSATEYTDYINTAATDPNNKFHTVASIMSGKVQGSYVKYDDVYKAAEEALNQSPQYQNWVDTYVRIAPHNKDLLATDAKLKQLKIAKDKETNPTLRKGFEKSFAKLPADIKKALNDGKAIDPKTLALYQLGIEEDIAIQTMATKHSFSNIDESYDVNKNPYFDENAYRSLGLGGGGRDASEKPVGSLESNTLTIQVPYAQTENAYKAYEAKKEVVAKAEANAKESFWEKYLWGSNEDDVKELSKAKADLAVAENTLKRQLDNSSIVQAFRITSPGTFRTINANSETEAQKIDKDKFLLDKQYRTDVERSMAKFIKTSKDPAQVTQMTNALANLKKSYQMYADIMDDPNRFNPTDLTIQKIVLNDLGSSKEVTERNEAIRSALQMSDLSTAEDVQGMTYTGRTFSDITSTDEFYTTTWDNDEKTYSKATVLPDEAQVQFDLTTTAIEGQYGFVARMRDKNNKSLYVKYMDGETEKYKEASYLVFPTDNRPARIAAYNQFDALYNGTLNPAEQELALKARALTRYTGVTNAETTIGKKKKLINQLDDGEVSQFRDDDLYGETSAVWGYVGDEYARKLGIGQARLVMIDKYGNPFNPTNEPIYVENPMDAAYEIEKLYQDFNKKK